jgi:hypothetical protein
MDDLIKELQDENVAFGPYIEDKFSQEYEIESDRYEIEIDKKYKSFANYKLLEKDESKYIDEANVEPAAQVKGIDLDALASAINAEDSQAENSQIKNNSSFDDIVNILTKTYSSQQPQNTTQTSWVKTISAGSNETNTPDVPDEKIQKAAKMVAEMYMFDISVSMLKSFSKGLKKAGVTQDNFGEVIRVAKNECGMMDDSKNLLDKHAGKLQDLLGGKDISR